MKHIAVYGQYVHKDAPDTIKAIITAFIDAGCDVKVEKDFYEFMDDIDLPGQVTTFDSLTAAYDLLISIGGDGTILRAVSYIGDLDVPILGINTGRLGFLATTHEDGIQSIVKQIMNGDYQLNKRSLITATSSHPENHLPPDNFALNEVTVSRMNTTSMIQIETHLDGEFLNSYWADGLIISTPTGSTGYSLSCGGPVISPTTDAFVITPIAPHNLNARPLVIHDNTVITVKVIGREKEFLTSLDNRIASYPNETEITLKKANFTIDLIQLNDQSFIKTLRHKLLWGEDKRN
ncbi:NAD kinase [Nonlabens ponticola]|uniref:NAD kinase n=1 Tax=Nonlabens ponticola TaxID=2496866 RepID=A0A3S9MUY6_9FLAO|nr:NAD kinase [Nonlabens ponticola]AZQ42995.1 NAD kinase [Nonlabens ponticola]